MSVPLGRQSQELFTSYLVTFDAFSRPCFHLLAIPILDRDPLDSDIWIIAQTTAEQNVWRCTLPGEARARGVLLAECLATRTRDAYRATELLSSCEFKVPQMFAGGMESPLPAGARLEIP
jgi:hypothetical protein